MGERIQSLRVAVLSSFNVDLIKSSLIAAIGRHGLDAELFITGYGQWETAAQDPNSKLFGFEPGAVILLLDSDDLVPLLAPGIDLPTEDIAAELGDAAWRRVDAVLEKLLLRLPGATVLCCNLVAAAASPLGLLEGNSGYSSGALVEQFNKRLRDRCRSEQRLCVIDYASLVLRHGLRAWTDRRLWHLGRMRLAGGALTKLSEYLARYVAALSTPRRKCLVLDLDNTLWGGVVGEDGMAGIEVGHEGVGLAYREFQLAALALYRRGIILAVSSKNNVDDVLPVLRDHPDMVLREEHFACMEIGWQSKADSVRRIALTLNIGLDSLVFWDDNPVEREMMRQQASSVYVPDVPEDVTNYASALLDLSCFDTLTLTHEDARRGQMYQEQASRAAYLDQTPPGSLEDFYVSLRLEVAIEPVKAETIARVAQLTQRTNQFNFTTRRYSVREIEEMVSAPEIHLQTLRLRDRFGDLGIVGLTILRADGDPWKLDSFLMSCRALGRGAEHALLASVAQHARMSGASLVGSFVPSAKNAPAREFLAKNGMDSASEGADGEWTFTVPIDFEWPPWIAKTA